MKKNLYIFIIKLNFDNYMLAVLMSITSFIAILERIIDIYGRFMDIIFRIYYK